MLDEKLENNVFDSIVHPSQDIKDFIRLGYIYSDLPIVEHQIQPASLDLRLGRIAYQLRSSFLPGGYSSIQDKIDKLKLAIKTYDLDDGLVLEPGKVYLIELLENLNLPENIWAKANPRSTTGRVDLFTRLLCDYSTEFEGVPLGYKGKLYAEIVPRTFSVLIRKETRVNQIRLMNINVPKVPLLSKEAGGENVSILSLDLTPDENSGIIGYKAKRNAPILDFDGSSCYNRLDFWDPIFLGELQSIVLNPDDFYILRSREKVNIPPYRAAELEPYDSSFGEFRVHYAGFLDPGFGFKKNSSEGTPVVLEVRARDVPFLIENGQKMARVLYYSLRDNAEKLYGSSIGSSYQTQDIALGKQFKRL